MWLNVYPTDSLPESNLHIPSSKPETQRAIVCASLAGGKSTVYNDLRCSETSATKQAMSAIGAGIVELNDRLEIEGVDHAPKNPGHVIDCSGSGFAFRTMSVLAAATPGGMILTGNKTLRRRIMRPMFAALSTLGVQFEHISEEGKAPVVIWSDRIKGGNCTVPGNTCSQFTTALLFGLPLAKERVSLNVTGEIRSASYIKQTLVAMRHAGVLLNVEEPSDCYEIAPARYQAVDTLVSGDFTSASYLMAIASLFPGKQRLHNMSRESFQGERLIVDVLHQLGIHVEFDESQRICLIDNQLERLSGDYSFDLRHSPNILPTLAVIGAFVEGRFRVTGGSVTHYHKSSRITAIATELRKLGVDISVIELDGIPDGFEIRGRTTYEGGVQFSSWKDHRIFLSLFIASLKTKKSNQLDGYQDIHCSFPDFFSQVEKLGINFHEVDSRRSHSDPIWQKQEKRKNEQQASSSSNSGGYRYC